MCTTNQIVSIVTRLPGVVGLNSGTAEVCGPPTQVDRTEAYRGRAATADSDSQPTGTVADVQIEFWTYNFGPNLLMERLRIEDGVVVEVQSLGYGFNEE
jgi:hypothetical protein